MTHMDQSGGLGSPPPAYSQVRGSLWGIGPSPWRAPRAPRVVVEVKFVMPSSKPGCMYEMDERKGSIEIAKLLEILEPEP